MATFTAIVERGDDRSWSVYTLSPSRTAGTGETKEAAVSDLRSAMSFWLEFMKDSGQTLPVETTEIIPFEVAA